MEWYLYLAVVGTGVLAGFINSMAGSGSLLTLPLLMFLGLPANVANGTNRIAILLQNVVGVGSFRQQKIITLKEGIWLALPAVAGSVIGALIALNFNEEVMEKTIAGLDKEIKAKFPEVKRIFVEAEDREEKSKLHPPGEPHLVG